MRKNVLSVLAVMLSGAWASAQQSQPGYASVKSSPTSAGAGVVVPKAAIPPEPGGVGNYPAAGSGNWGPVYGGYPAGAGQPAPGVPMGASPGMAFAPEYSGGFGPGFTLDPPSSFGTETIWISARYLNGWLSRGQLNTALVTTGSVADAHPGALGDPGTVVLYGNNQYQFGNLNGAQVEVGVNLNNRFYLDLSGMVYAPRHSTSVFASDAAGNPFLGRPVFNTLVGEQRSYLTSSPGLVAGTTTVQGRLQVFGFEGNVRYNVNLTPYLSVDALVGYRRLQLEDDLSISDQLLPTGGSITFLGSSISAPNALTDYDRFAATNQFNGVNFGTRFRWQSGFEWFAMNGYGKLAFGATRQTVEIEGYSSATTAAGTQTATGGVLALSSNIGHHQRTVFGVITEGGVGISILPWKNVRFQAGYSATYWNSVVRPGDHIDPNVNPALVPTDVNFGSGNPGAFPAFTFKSRSVWLQSINFGVELYY